MPFLFPVIDCGLNIDVKMQHNLLDTKMIVFYSLNPKFAHCFKAVLLLIAK